MTSYIARYLVYFKVTYRRIINGAGSVDSAGLVQVDVLGRPVPHELELTVGRHEVDDTVRIELAGFHALVELAVLERDPTRYIVGPKKIKRTILRK